MDLYLSVAVSECIRCFLLLLLYCALATHPAKFNLMDTMRLVNDIIQYLQDSIIIQIKHLRHNLS